MCYSSHDMLSMLLYHSCAGHFTWSQTKGWHARSCSAEPHTYGFICLTWKSWTACWPGVSVGQCPFPVSSEIAGSLCEAVRLKSSTSSLMDSRGCQGLCNASWQRMVWMCVIKPTVCCLRMEVSVVSQLFCKNRAVLLAAFLWCWCACDYTPHCLVLLIWWSLY